MVTVKEHSLLWNKIQDFRLDEENAVVKFSDKLAFEQNWSAAFTKRAIEEYRKFIFLCCISDKGASPSYIVDQVWHLHLTYTQSYWVDFCRNTLQRDLHHHPSAGGDQEDHKHEEWYKETLALYETVFGMMPPSDIWPRPAAVSTFIEEPVFRANINATIAIPLILLLPLLFIYVQYGEVSPFSLTGPEFLQFFFVYAVAILGCVIISRSKRKEQLKEIAATWFPAAASDFQVAKFLYGKHRAVQAGLVDLLKRNLLELDRSKRFTVWPGRYMPSLQEANPLVPAFLREPDGNRYEYIKLVKDWYDEERFSHPAFTALFEFAHRKESFFRRNIYLIAFNSIAFLRICQGFLNGRPVMFLFMEAFFLSIVIFIVHNLLSRKAFIFKEVERLYKERVQRAQSYGDEVLSSFVVNGVSSIKWFAEGVLLAGVFSAYAPLSFYNDTWRGSNGSSCSSCGGSSDGGGGGSCGGGGGCGGGGCGGCGGGD